MVGQHDHLLIKAMPWFRYARTTEGPRPLVVVRLWRGSASTPVRALVDSGADSCLFDLQHAELIGLDRRYAEKESAITASGGDLATWKWPLESFELEFAGRRFPFRGAFADLAPRGGLDLLGRRDFFAPFIIQLWDAEEMMNIDLSPISQPLEPARAPAASGRATVGRPLARTDQCGDRMVTRRPGTLRVSLPDILRSCEPQQTERAL